MVQIKESPHKKEKGSMNTDVTTRETPFGYMISGIPAKLVLTYELKKFDRIQMEKYK